MQAVQEIEGLRLSFGGVAQTYQEAMDGLCRIAHQIALTKHPDETLSHLVALQDVLVGSKPEDPLEDRLVPLTGDDVRALDRYGSFRILSLLRESPLAQLEYVPLGSPFEGFYQYPNPVTVVDLCPKSDEMKPGMRLIAIRADNPRRDFAETDEFPYNIGWVTEQELKSLLQKNRTI